MALHILLNFQCLLVLLCLQLASTTETPITASRVITKPGCQDKCGNVSIPYPFGIGDGCFIKRRFELKCNDSLPYSTRFPVQGSNIKISNISIPDGEMTALLRIARDCSDKSKQLADNFKKNKDTSAHLGRFTFSNTKNKFIAIGCDTLAYLGTAGSNAPVGTGCLTYCNDVGDTTNGTCNGIGCCEASIPAGLKTYAVEIKSISTSRRNLDFNPCSYAFLTEKNSFNFSSSYLENFRNHGRMRVPAVIDWIISTKTCEEAQRNPARYACGPNTDCVKGNNEAKGYRCSCKTGYEGNPYLNTSTGGHCQDIDECSGINNCTSMGLGSKCKNKEGTYKCFCDKGYKEIRNQCSPIQSRRIFNEIVLGASLSLSLLLVIGFGLYWVHRKRKHMKVREEFFKQNGGLILNRLLDEREEDMENSRKGSKMGKGEKKHRSIATIYTEKELSKATNNYHDTQILGRGGFGTVYKGTLSNGNVVAIKKTKIVNMDQNEQFINEIAVLSQINHKNVVQLLGCCLESEVPLLVYEYVGNGTLYQHLHEHPDNQGRPAFLSWESRLRIASEVAGSLAYLHAEASIPIIHRDIKSSNVLLDDDYRAKVSDFGASRLNPTDEAQLSTIVQGTIGYLDPEYMQSSQLTEKSDVYSFGVLLVELLTGKAIFSLDRPEEDRNLANYFLSSMKTNRLFAILDSSLVQNDNERVSSVHEHQQIQQMAELAQKCLRMKGENRPTMKEVAMVLHGLLMISSSYPGILDAEETMRTTKEEHMLLLESAELLSYTDSSTTIGDSSKRITALATEGR
ncbi:hypothetical protein C5167_015828 [Papaver somniferum]|uniref:Protein kinase domain-containing protein n=1 Tax=Papaver somniferum TaxID=3469 RepID=A0A4Y7JBG8_PAPSO|nr:wall-associated receptor kinase 2-like [Papaver somniferum]RZC56975.1 hypothetical protein C5167_015828 [Papaver somniferum]